MAEGDRMLESPLAPYLYWAKSRQAASIDLAGSNLLHCTIDELPGARDALDLTARNDNGYPPLVEAIADHYQVATDRIVSAGGCSGANFLAIAATVAAGDHVLIERPGYDPLLGACLLMGARVDRFDRRFERGFAIDTDDLKKRVTSHTRLIVVSTPHNPSGVSLGSEALNELAQVAASVGAHVLVDEVYLDAASLVRGDLPTARSAGRLDGPFIVTNSLTKSYGLAGLRSGWAVAPAPSAERMRRTRDVVDNAGSAPADRLAALAFGELSRLGERARRLLSTNLEIARSFVSDHSQLELVEPPQASVMFPRLTGVSDSDPFVARLLSQHGVAVAPGRFFDAPAHFRVSLAGDTGKLRAGLDALSRELRTRAQE
jgi:aspartate/methionine/tyrosine aminotransferase